MRFKAFDAVALALPGAVMEVKWGEDRCYCVCGKMFAFAGRLGDETPRYMFKCSDLSFEMLVESGAAVPAPYLARAKWVQLISHDALPDETLARYVVQAHGVIAAKLTKKARAEIGLQGRQGAFVFQQHPHPPNPFSRGGVFLAPEKKRGHR